MNMAMDTQTDKAARRKTAPLTRREAEIVALLAQGMSNPTIGEELGIAIKTVQNHMNSILAKIAPPPWADPRVYLSLWHLGDSKRLQELSVNPSAKRSARKKVGSAT
ncbi:MAG: response regulator transcription factor [Chloroflexi bacterium]|nr:response regulator transcription factor [Chloroflexota bacterium]